MSSFWNLYASVFSTVMFSEFRSSAIIAENHVLKRAPADFYFDYMLV